MRPRLFLRVLAHRRVALRQIVFGRVVWCAMLWRRYALRQRAARTRAMLSLRQRLSGLSFRPQHAESSRCLLLVSYRPLANLPACYEHFAAAGGPKSRNYTHTHPFNCRERAGCKLCKASAHSQRCRRVPALQRRRATTTARHRRGADAFASWRRPWSSAY